MNRDEVHSTLRAINWLVVIWKREKIGVNIMDVKGKVVIITGGARGLGKGYAEALLKRGAKVGSASISGLSMTLVAEWESRPFRATDMIDGDYWSLQWRNNGHDGVSNHQPHDCLLNRLFRRRSKKISKFRVTAICEGNSPVIGEFPTQRASDAENVSIWWRHRV